MEAGLATLVPPYEAIAAGTADLRARLAVITEAMIRLTLENETAFRQYLALAVPAPVGARTRGAIVRPAPCCQRPRPALRG